MKVFSLLGAAVTTVLLAAPSAPACPLCESETGRQVRAGIFNAEFVPALLLVLAPFPIFLGVVAAIHFGLPFRPKHASRRAPPAAASIPGPSSPVTEA